MQQDDTESVFAGILQKFIKVDGAKVTRDKRFREDLGIDSLAMVDVAVAVEDKFGVRLPDDDVESFATVGEAVDFIQRAKNFGHPL